MIIRILGEGQYQVDGAAATEMEALDTEIDAAFEREDEVAFDAALRRLLGRVRSVGVRLPADSMTPSELILPHEGASLADVRTLLADGEPAADGGVVPG